MDLAARLRIRAAQEGITLPDNLIDPLLAYFDLLQRWNRKINLTSLSDSDEAVDRLVLEPLAAAKHLPSTCRLADLGSGGGSPAIPLALALRATELLMVESRSRKAAFLREAAREVGLTATVESRRFEEVSQQSSYIGAFDVVSLRAVRPDIATLTAAGGLLNPGGILALFGGPNIQEMAASVPRDLTWRATHPLLRSSGSWLMLLFHVEQS